MPPRLMVSGPSLSRRMSLVRKVVVEGGEWDFLASTGLGSLTQVADRGFL